MPSRGRIAPGTFDRAPLQPDEEGLTPEMDALPLPAEERLVDRVEVGHPLRRPAGTGRRSWYPRGG